MRRFLFFLLLLLPAAATAQVPAQLRSVPLNTVDDLHAEGDTLWIGSRLAFTTDGGDRWQLVGADSLYQGPGAGRGRGRVYSIDVEGRTIWAGLGIRYQEEIDGQQQSVDAAVGFLYSTDGGQSWSYRLPPLDAREDSVETYGVSTLRALPVVVPQQSPPWDIDIDPETGAVWTAGWASGLRVSTDEGRSWERVVLPPDTADAIDPEVPYDFYYAVLYNEGQARIERHNFSGFAVLVDETGTVWAGTAGGLNRSTDARARGADATWRRFSYNGTPGGLIGNWVISIEEQPLAGRNPVWATNWRAVGQDEAYGVVVTRDGGETFEQMLHGERIYDFAFRGETVYAAGDNGLFVSDDGGRTWRTINSFRSPEQPDQLLRPDIQLFAVAATEDALWAGTSDGLLKSTDGGESWRIFRTDVPVRPDEPTDARPAVDSYAYPNPYSPATDGFLRIRYGDAPEPVTVRIYDFGMGFVRELTEADGPGAVPEVIWDGTDARGARVANGAYLYAARTGGGTVWGKILVIE